MIVLVVGLTVAVALLSVLVAGLLRSHAEILRSLHELGAGRQDTAPGSSGSRAGQLQSLPFGVGPGVMKPGDGSGVTGASAADISGITPSGDSVQLSVTASGAHTLLAFLSSGCLTCHGFWEHFAAGSALTGARLVVVTQGPERESASAVRKLAGPNLLVVMSTASWETYEVPGSPYFVLVDGGRVRGEGSATSWQQVQRLLGEAIDDSALARAAHQHPAGHPAGPGYGPDTGDGAYREARADRELLAAGIAPGHPSLQLSAEELTVSAASATSPTGEVWIDSAVEPAARERE